MAQGGVRLFRRKRRLQRSNESDPSDVEDRAPGIKITAEFQQCVRLQTFTSLNPALTYCAMVPDDAEIIQRVRANDVHGVQELLQQGSASLTDCDTVGNPLLYVRAWLAMLEVR